MQLEFALNFKEESHELSSDNMVAYKPLAKHIILDIDQGTSVG